MKLERVFLKLRDPVDVRKFLVFFIKYQVNYIS